MGGGLTIVVASIAAEAVVAGLTTRVGVVGVVATGDEVCGGGLVWAQVAGAERDVWVEEAVATAAGLAEEEAVAVAR